MRVRLRLAQRTSKSTSSALAPSHPSLSDQRCQHGMTVRKPDPNKPVRSRNSEAVTSGPSGSKKRQVQALGLQLTNPGVLMLDRRSLFASFAAIAVAMPAMADSKPFKATDFESARTSGKAVLVEVTAPWCPTCKRRSRSSRT